MLKKMLKAVLTIALVAGLAAPVMAETKIGGKAAAYFGQYTSGVDGDTAYLDENDEVNLNVVSKRGPVTALLQIEADRAGGGYFHNTRRALSYQMNDMLGFKIGTNVSSVPFSVLGGFKAHTVPGQFVGIYWGFAEGDGLGVKAKFGTMSAQLTLYDGDVLGHPFTGSSGTNAGSATQLGFNGKFGPIAAKLSVVTAKNDNHSGNAAYDSTADVRSDSASTVSLKYSLESMSFSVDIFSKTKGTADPDTGNAIQAKIGAGPGKAIVTIASRAMANKTAITWTNLIYDIPLDKAAALQAFYASEATTPDGGAAITKSYVGAGFYAKF